MQFTFRTQNCNSFTMQLILVLQYCICDRVFVSHHHEKTDAQCMAVMYIGWQLLCRCWDALIWDSWIRWSGKGPVRVDCWRGAALWPLVHGHQSVLSASQPAPLLGGKDSGITRSLVPAALSRSGDVDRPRCEAISAALTAGGGRSKVGAGDGLGEAQLVCSEQGR